MPYRPLSPSPFEPFRFGDIASQVSNNQVNNQLKLRQIQQEDAQAQMLKQKAMDEIAIKQEEQKRKFTDDFTDMISKLEDPKSIETAVNAHNNSGKGSVMLPTDVTYYRRQAMVKDPLAKELQIVGSIDPNLQNNPAEWRKQAAELAKQKGGPQNINIAMDKQVNAFKIKQMEESQNSYNTAENDLNLSRNILTQVENIEAQNGPNATGPIQSLIVNTFGDIVSSLNPDNDFSRYNNNMKLLQQDLKFNGVKVMSAYLKPMSESDRKIAEKTFLSISSPIEQLKYLAKMKVTAAEHEKRKNWAKMKMYDETSANGDPMSHTAVVAKTNKLFNFGQVGSVDGVPTTFSEFSKIVKAKYPNATPSEIRADWIELTKQSASKLDNKLSSEYDYLLNEME